MSEAWSLDTCGERGGLTPMRTSGPLELMPGLVVVLAGALAAEPAESIVEASAGARPIGTKVARGVICTVSA